MKSSIIFITLIIVISGFIYVYVEKNQINGISYSIENTKLPSLSKDYRCLYKSEIFDAFVDDSYENEESGNKKEFYDFMDKSYMEWKNTPGNKIPFETTENFDGIFDEIKNNLHIIKNKNEKAAKEKEIGAWLHKFIKAIIPKFSLERGYDFKNVVKYGERQCFLQSVLIAGLLEKCGIDAGVFMVYINDKGQDSNNGHAVVVMRLSDGKDILVDASDPEPFMKHKGLFVHYNDCYYYVNPVYNNKSEIESYKARVNNKDISTREILPLDTDFSRSQFYFYRAEWIKGGLHEKVMTKEGLSCSAFYMEKSVSCCKENPLAVYMLGRIYEKLGEKDNAIRCFKNARVLYETFGWIPGGLKEKMKTYHL